jgi:precorrin-6Y C5,15-methyltransferase (decarboxylating)
MEALGGPRERLREARAEGFAMADIGPLVCLAIECAPGAPGLSRVAGRSDALFAHDNQITRAPVRAVTLAALAPRPGEMLWDLGAGSGSVAVEWCLAGGRAIAVEARADRLANVAANIADFGLSGRMEAREGRLPVAIEGLPPPDAVFVGGGASPGLMARLLALVPGTRIVVNAVTLETEALVTTLQAERGGSLLRMEFAEAAPLGGFRGWQAARPVVQWSIML